MIAPGTVETQAGTKAGSMLAWALLYVDRGWPVFPCHTALGYGTPCLCLAWRQTGACAHLCSCMRECGRDRGKHPRTRHGCKDATLDQGQVERWWRSWPDANIGIATGHGCDVLDLDVSPDKNGEANLHLAMAGKGVEIDNWRPLRVSTGSGGVHLYGQPTGRSIAADTTLGIDWRGAGGYVIAPPSIHMSGERYAWVTDPMAELEDFPAAVIEIAKPKRAGGTYGVSAPTRILRAEDGDGTKDGIDRLRRACDSIASSALGASNATLYREAIAVYEIAAAGHLATAFGELVEIPEAHRYRRALEIAEDEAGWHLTESWLHAAARKAGMHVEVDRRTGQVLGETNAARLSICKTIASAAAKGMGQPRSTDARWWSIIIKTGRTQ